MYIKNIRGRRLRARIDCKAWRKGREEVAYITLFVRICQPHQPHHTPRPRRIHYRLSNLNIYPYYNGKVLYLHWYCTLFILTYSQNRGRFSTGSVKGWFWGSASGDFSDFFFKYNSLRLNFISDVILYREKMKWPIVGLYVPALPSSARLFLFDLALISSGKKYVPR